MPIHPGDPLRKVTLNLFEADVEAAEILYGHGWSTVLRDLWQSHLRQTKALVNLSKPQTLGDLEKPDGK